MDITLEKVDKVRERTGASYAESKHALEQNNGDIIDAIIYLEEIKGLKDEKGVIDDKDKKYESIEEFKLWLKELISKGNVTRIRISKDEKEIINVPVNAGIAAGVIAIILPPVLAFVVIAAVAAQITIEITKVDGSVEVVNKYITKAVDGIKDVATDLGSKVRGKVEEVKNDVKSPSKNNHKASDGDETVYSYTVKFDEEE